MNLSELREIFASPGSSYRSMPFWAWNDSLCAEELVRQIHSMKEQGMGGFFIHSREGLETVYMSEEWFSLVKTCVDEAKALGMEAWLYDEDRWPSGTAGGRVTAEGGDDSRCKGLTIEVTQGFSYSEDILSAYKATVDHMVMIGFTRLDISDIPPLNTGETYLVCRLEVSGKSEWFNNESPPDNLNAASVARFLDITHNAYKERIGGEFGGVVKGIFTDEPGLHDSHAAFNPKRGWIPWTYGFESYFKTKYGYDALDYIPLVFFNAAGSSAIRHDYWRAVTELYCESYSKQIGEWCADNNIAFTGHFLQEHRLGLAARVNGAVMPHYVHLHIPGIDLLEERTDEYLTVRQCTSVANQYGKPRVITETYGCAGWGFTFEGQKWIGDFQYVMGVNFRCHHLALYSIRGCRKRDYPPVFNYNTTWWRFNRVTEDYFARLSAVLSQGKPIRELLVIHPSTTAWAMLGANPYGNPIRRNERDVPEIDGIGDEFNRLLKYLMGIHYDYDLGDELLIEKDGFVRGSLFGIKECAYKTVILPPLITMLESTYRLLLEYMDNGGKVIALKPFAEMLNGRVNADISLLFSHKNLLSAEDLIDLGVKLTENLPKIVSIENAFGQEIMDIYYMIRELGGGTRILFVVNNNRKTGYSAKIKLNFRAYAEEWSALTGAVSIPYCTHSENTVIHTDLGHAGSKLFVLCDAQPNGMIPNSRNTEYLEYLTSIGPEYAFTRDMPNALTLDMCSYSVNGEAYSGEMQVWEAQREVRNRLGMRQVYANGLEQRYKWVNEPHPSNGAKVMLKFRFNVKELPENGLCLALESPERFNISLNGYLSDNAKQGYYIDRSIEIVRLDGARAGDNELLLECAYMNHFELEDCYIIGDFGVDTERRITAEPRVLRLGDWCLQGYFHYPGSMVYKGQFTLETRENLRFFARADEFFATVMELRVNGAIAGQMPWRSENVLEITEMVAEGVNEIELEIAGSPRNLFGPFHLRDGEPVSTGWGTFRAANADYTAQYNLRPYGLFGNIRIYRI